MRRDNNKLYEHINEIAAIKDKKKSERKLNSKSEL